MPLVLLLILLSALPDAMLVPVLRDLLVERYGASAQAAQAFLAVNLLGAALAIPLSAQVRSGYDPNAPAAPATEAPFLSPSRW